MSVSQFVETDKSQRKQTMPVLRALAEMHAKRVD
jgi:hypothetical protein